ncbi:peritrophin-1-like [Sabethes cyaneus]|uniref:peritrophin-1-like n=1 Tax=Sabethes cyaneus TaxID=53552 RepID=UPI00237E0B34|nr:peritrophin-1-like [Sabethes cyaneus]
MFNTEELQAASLVGINSDCLRASTVKTIKMLTLFIVGCLLATGAFAQDPRCPAICDPLDQPVFLPHEWDCSKYYVCSNGYAVEMQCPDPLLWNQSINVCDWPWAVTCSLPPTTTTTSRPPPTPPAGCPGSS